MKVATPPLMLCCPKGAVPSEKVTVPVAEVGAKVAVSVKGTPCAALVALAVSATVVACGAAVRFRVAFAPLSAASPL